MHNAYFILLFYLKEVLYYGRATLSLKRERDNC